MDYNLEVSLGKVVSYYLKAEPGEVAHTFNFSTQEIGTRGSESSRPSWSPVVNAKPTRPVQKDPVS